MFTPEELKLVMRIIRQEFGSRGGAARAKKLSKRRRAQIARLAAKTRWAKEKTA